MLNVRMEASLLAITESLLIRNRHLRRAGEALKERNARCVVHTQMGKIEETEEILHIKPSASLLRRAFVSCPAKPLVCQVMSQIKL